MKITTFKNGAYIVFDKNPISGFYTVVLKSEAGNVLDKISTDTYRSALAYKRAFTAIGRSQK